MKIIFGGQMGLHKMPPMILLDYLNPVSSRINFSQSFKKEVSCLVAAKEARVLEREVPSVTGRS